MTEIAAIIATALSATTSRAEQDSLDRAAAAALMDRHPLYPQLSPLLHPGLARVAR